jgi:nucleoside phosphorylase
MTTPAELPERVELARMLLSSGRTSIDDQPLLDEMGIAALAPEPALAAELNISFPDGLAPVPRPIDPRPASNDVLPEADVVVITWTVAEHEALCDVLTPRFSRLKWIRYDRDFAAKYDAQIRAGAPAKKSRSLGSYFMTEIDNKKVLCFKSELHLNQDGVRTGDGTATLPVKDLFLQIIKEAKPKVVLTVGTCGGIDVNHDLGDVLVTRGAKFRLQSEFKQEPYANQAYKSDWALPTTHFTEAEELMDTFAQNLREPDFGPPTKRYNFTGPLLKAQANKPSIIHENGATPANTIKAFHPILSTDFFEFGTSSNAAELLQIGCGLEMGDAALGLAASELVNPPKWAVIRNISDPQINGDLPKGSRALNMQAHWAVWYYEAYGYHTSVNSALATWAIIAGL